MHEDKAMRANALYFPFISIPKSAWVIKTLLYWDKFASIVPFEYVENPELFTPFMQDLVREGLVEQVLPRNYIWEIEEFERTFIKYIEKKLPNHKRFSLFSRRKINKHTTRRSKVHMEKLGDLPYWLEKKGLAAHVDNSWYEVDDWVAGPFMAYLATLLGRFEEVNAAPITDNLYLAHYFKDFKTAYRTTAHSETRDYILNQLLPVPDQTVSLDDLLKFKCDYGHLLPSLRMKIETYSAEVASIEDKEARRARKDAIALDFKEDLEQVKDAMSFFWKKIAFEVVAPLVGAGGALYVTDPNQSAIAAGAAGFAFIAACYQALANANPERILQNKPLAYLAFAEKKLKNA